MSKVLLISFLMFVAMYCNCTQPLAGGSSQQGNGMVVGSVVSKNGCPAINTQIRIRPISYVELPESSSVTYTKYDTKTDSTGHFSISGVDLGSYAIEANDRTSSAALVKITVTRQDETTNAGSVGLKPYSLISGIVNGTIPMEHSALYIQVQGLERLIPVGNDGTFTIANLPEGNFNLHLVSTDSAISPVDLFDIKAKSGDTTLVVIGKGWRYSHRLYLNTTALGANVTTDVMNFPVLVRLTSANFDFSQAKINGADIRFTKPDNTFLPYEIERWDATNKAAEIWVKVDTVHGNDSTQFFIMHWGSQIASDSSNSAAVFDTSAGFSAVWHLGDESDSIHDATINTFNGKNSGSAVDTGMIGNSRSFSNGNYIKVPGLINSPSTVTLSAWVKSDTYVEPGQDILSLGDAVLIRLDDFNMGTTGSFNTDSVNFTMTGSKRNLIKTGWHYIAYSINSTTHVQTFYVDGVQCAVTNVIKPIYYSGVGTDTYIGKHGNGKTFFNLVGLIDEVRVNNISVSPDWIKLCYMNQKSQDALLKW